MPETALDLVDPRSLVEAEAHAQAQAQDLLGPAKFLLLYFVCIYVSGLGSVIGETALPVWQGFIPGLGASGAIMGVVGAYLFLFYEERIRTLPIIFFGVPIPFIFYLPRFPVWVFILYTIIKDVLNGWLIDLSGHNYSTIFLIGPAFFGLAFACMRRIRNFASKIPSDPRFAPVSVNRSSLSEPEHAECSSTG